MLIGIFVRWSYMIDVLKIFVSITFCVEILFTIRNKRPTGRFFRRLNCYVQFV